MVSTEYGERLARLEEQTIQLKAQLDEAEDDVKAIVAIVQKRETLIEEQARVQDRRHLANTRRLNALLAIASAIAAYLAIFHH